MGAIFKLLSWPQRILVGALGAGFAATLFFNVMQMVENRHLVKVNANLSKRIDDPETGYVVRLSQARTNTETCKGQISRQNDEIERLGRESARRVNEAQTRYNSEFAARLKAERSAAAFLARDIKGQTLSERVLDVDAQILGDMK